MLYKDWIYTWLENYVKPTNKDKTYRHYYQNVTLHIVPKLGEYELNDLSPLIVQQFVTELLNNGNLKTGKGLEVTTVNSMITTIQLSLTVAKRLGVAEKYEMDNIKRPKVGETKVSCFSISEQKKIEQAVLKDKREKMKGIVICLYKRINMMKQN